jgi:hypothetical protein
MVTVFVRLIYPYIIFVEFIVWRFRIQHIYIAVVVQRVIGYLVN